MQMNWVGCNLEGSNTGGYADKKSSIDRSQLVAIYQLKTVFPRLDIPFPDFLFQFSDWNKFAK